MPYPSFRRRQYVTRLSRMHKSNVPARPQSGLTQQNQETINVGLKLDQYVGVATYGVTKKIDVSVIVPINRVSLSSSPVATNYYVTPENTIPAPPYNNPSINVGLGYFHGTASGIGDMLINVKGVAYSGEKNTIAAGMLVRFPTGDSLNYLGSGAYGFNPYGVWSRAGSKISPHVRLGYQFNTATTLIPSDPVNGTGSSACLADCNTTSGPTLSFLAERDHDLCRRPLR